MKKKHETFKQPELAAFLLPKQCRVLPAGMVDEYLTMDTERKKKLLELADEIAYNNRIKK